MRITKRGIGIDKVSFGLSGVAVYGNDKFAEWGKDGARISKLVNPGGGELVIVMRLDKTVPRTQTTAYYPSNSWRNNYTAEQRKLKLLPKFGLTGPTDVNLSDDGQELRITMPPAAQRAKLLRGRNNKLKADSKAAKQLELEGVSPPYTNTLDKVMADVQGEAQALAPAPVLEKVPAPDPSPIKAVDYPAPRAANGAITLEQALAKLAEVAKMHGMRITATVNLGGE